MPAADAGRTAGRPAPAHRIRILAPDSPDLDRAAGAVGAGFSDTDDIRPTGTSWAAAGHSPRGDVSELTGIAVLPRARRKSLGSDIVRALVADALRRGVTTVFLSAQDAAAARICERVGFARVGPACIAERLEDG